MTIKVIIEKETENKETGKFKIITPCIATELLEIITKCYDLNDFDVLEPNSNFCNDKENQEIIRGLWRIKNDN